MLKAQLKQKHQRGGIDSEQLSYISDDLSGYGG
jgi:hypothetical protein